MTASLEIRDLSLEVIQKVYRAIKKKTEEIAEASNVTVEFLPLDTTAEPALTDTKIQKEIASSAKSLGLTYQYMPSGAGHDAQDISRFAPWE